MAKRRRRRGGGSVYFDHNARVWVACVSLGVRNGKRVRHKATASTPEAADAELDKLLRSYRSGGNPATMTLDAYMGSWLLTHGPSVKPSTLRSYADHVKLHISPLLGGIVVARLRPADVRRLIADRIAAGKSPATVKLIIATLRAGLQQAVNDRAIPDNPAAGVDLPLVQREPVLALSEEDAERIIAATSGTFVGPLVVLLLGSGLRLGEACGLDWRDVKLDESFVLVRRSKTTVRAVPISDDAVTALRDHLAHSRRIGLDEPVFLGPRTGERLRTGTVSHAFPRLLIRAGLYRLTPHGLRHGAASIMVARGAHMRVIAEQLGHRNPALTARTYAHVLPQSQREAVKLLNRTAGKR